MRTDTDGRDSSEAKNGGLTRAVLTDVQFWIPLGVLLGGLGLLFWLH